MYFKRFGRLSKFSWMRNHSAAQHSAMIVAYKSDKGTGTGYY